MKHLIIYLLFLLLIISCSKQPSEYILDVSVTPINSGNVNPTSGVFEDGTSVTIQCTPSEGYIFKEWTGGITGNLNPITVSMNSDKIIIGVFEKKQYPLNITIQGEGTVTQELIQTKSTTYPYGSIVKLTGIPNDGWELVEWSGDYNGTESSIEVNVRDTMDITVKFTKYYNYNIPSYEWKNNFQPWIDLVPILEPHGFSRNDSYNTGVGYGDFDFDGYLDMMIQPNVSDGEVVEFYFLTNDGEDGYSIDNSIKFVEDIETISSRKTIVGDFNGDNKPDVVRTSGGHDILKRPTITLSTEDGFVLQEIKDSPNSQFHSVCSGDIDNDGDLDLFFSQSGILDGFCINDGSSHFTWKYIIDVIDNFTMTDIDGTHGLYGIWTSEMYDVNKDRKIDLIIGGGYGNGEEELHGHTILWGDGSGKFDFNNSEVLPPVELYGQIWTGYDFGINDIDGDGIDDIVVFNYYQLDNDPQNDGYTTSKSYIQVFKGDSNYNYTDVTNDWISDPELDFSITWILLRDVDNNGSMDIVESESKVVRMGGIIENSVRWEWNGSSFTRLN